MEIALIRPSGADDARDLTRLVHDGLVRHVAADVYVAVDVPDVRGVRAAAVDVVVPDRLVAAGAVLTGPDAAWLYAGGPPPGRLHVTLPARRGRPGSALVVVHEGRLPPDDLDVVDGVQVVVPARAAADVARLLPPDGAQRVLRRLASTVPFDPRDALVRLERLAGCRGVEEARPVLLAWAEGRAPAGVAAAPADRTAAGPADGSAGGPGPW